MTGIVGSLPDFAKDLRLNYSSILREELMTARQKIGILLVSALTCRSHELARAIKTDASSILDEKALGAIYSAASIMAMNNVYYRFTHVVEHEIYRTLPARLRMNVIANPGVDKIDFELWSLAASVINGCARCVNAHESTLRAQGIREDAVQAAVRYAALISGLAIAIDIAQASEQSKNKHEQELAV